MHTVTGTFVDRDDNVITLSPSSPGHKGASTNTTHNVQPGANVTLNDKPAKLAELRAGDTVVLEGDPASKVTATR